MHMLLVYFISKINFTYLIEFLPFYQEKALKLLNNQVFTTLAVRHL